LGECTKDTSGKGTADGGGACCNELSCYESWEDTGIYFITLWRAWACSNV